ncbi:FISUMP domain-containing protein [Flavobacteriaceae bacterium S356]|uniref:FISUMP domain-containing protein n=1 Tax=Asprobacillus argus TaxID=3076534 RepID=A0ABU3LCH6_9FLAO|nr:FISUMP domain-containing protein [Flavobacteriaceae bacterium S356]
MRKIIVGASLLVMTICNAQIGIGTNTPDPSAALEVQSTTKGFLPPRMTETQMSAISAPAEGLMVYCTNCSPKGLYIFDGFVFNNTAGTASVGTPSVTGAGGAVWMDRNLGATQVATSSTDYLAYGNLYQWGRTSDGHEVINWTSSTTSDNAEQSNETAGPVASGAEGTNFITVPSQQDWLTVQDDARWDGANKGVHDPCPTNFRVPTIAEWDAERLSWSSNNSSGAFASPLKLTLASSRLINGELFFPSFVAYYWSSTVSGNNARHLSFNTTSAELNSFARAHGTPIRCIRTY